MFDYKQYLPSYIAHGKPSADTLRHYEDEIDNYLEWLDGNAYGALEIDESDALRYLQFLYDQGYADASVNLKIAAVRSFYHVANKLRLIAENPFKDVKPKAPAYDDTDFEFLNPDEIREICLMLSAGAATSAINLRDLAIVMLMAVEGLRTVEVHRMNDEDINTARKSILIHGKGRDGYIFPCEDTFSILQRYIKSRPAANVDADGTPTFVSMASNFKGTRITRNGIRWAINHVLIAADKKKVGAACHMLRHSCGTNLYAATKDLRLVQETLRQKDPAVTARYTHVTERLTARPTQQLSPLGGVDLDPYDM